MDPKLIAGTAAFISSVISGFVVWLLTTNMQSTAELAVREKLEPQLLEAVALTERTKGDLQVKLSQINADLLEIEEVAEKFENVANASAVVKRIDELEEGLRHSARLVAIQQSTSAIGVWEQVPQVASEFNLYCNYRLHRLTPKHPALFYLDEVQPDELRVSVSAKSFYKVLPNNTFQLIKYSLDEDESSIAIRLERRCSSR